MIKLKNVIAIGAAILLALTLVGCGNRTIFDTTYSFERAIIYLPNGETIEGKCSAWDDYSDSDMVQVTIEGKTYLTHSTNVVLISE